MPDPVSPLNPYAPSTIQDDAVEARQLARALNGNDPSRRDIESPKPLTLRKTAVRWLVVCTISAIPSFVFGLIVTQSQFGGMLIGILIFVAGYTWLDYSTAKRPWRRSRRMRRTLRIAYGTRIAISVLFPIGAFLDVLCGFVTLAVTSPITRLNGGGGPLDLFGAVLTTLLQGCVLNVVLACYAVLIYLAQLATSAIRGTKPPNAIEP